MKEYTLGPQNYHRVLRYLDLNGMTVSEGEIKDKEGELQGKIEERTTLGWGGDTTCSAEADCKLLTVYEKTELSDILEE